MFETVQEVVNNPYVLPTVLGGVGYVVGQFAEGHARNTIAKNRAPLLDAHSGIQQENLSRQSILRRGLAHLALLTTITGVTLGITLTPDQPQKTTPTSVEMVADHSYQTGVDGSAKIINKIAERFSNVNSLNTKTIVAHNGTYDRIETKQLSKDTPYGPPSMSEAIQSAEANGNNGAILVVADGSITNPANNLVGNESLVQIATQTKGVAWTAGVSTGTVASAVKAKMVAGQETSNSTGYDDTLRYILAGLTAGLAGITIAQYFRRKSETAVS